MDIEVRSPRSEGELEQMWHLLHRSFNFPLADADKFAQQTPDWSRVLGVFHGTEPVAMSRIRPFGTWFGGRRIGLAGYSPVGVAPEHRGQGYGSLVTSAHYPDLRARGEVIAGLYPASTRLYRGVGFELAGAWTERSLPARSLQMLPPSGLVVRRATSDDIPAIKDCYARLAPATNGFLDRNEVWWDRLLVGSFDERHCYVVDGDGGALAGYVLYTHQPAKDWGFVIRVGECMAADRDVQLALWRMIGSSSTMAREVKVVGPPEHPLLLLLPEQDLTTGTELRWMLRIVDAEAAVAQRGFPAGVQASVELDVEDRHCDWNSGRWRLAVDGGEGRLERSTAKGRAAVGLSVNALACLWSGYTSSRALAAAGLLRQATPADLDALDAVFAGPTPWTPDFY